MDNSDLGMMQFAEFFLGSEALGSGALIMKATFQNFATLLEIALIIPVSTDDCDRIFSAETDQN